MLFNTIDIVQKFIEQYKISQKMWEDLYSDIEKIIEAKIRHLLPEMIFTDHFEENQTTYVIYKDNTGNHFIDSVRDISKRKDLIMKFSAKDAYLLGYLVGCESHEEI